MTGDSSRARYASFLLGGCGRSTSVRAGVVTGVVAVVALATMSPLYLVNAYGPFADHVGLGWLAVLGCSALMGAVVFTLTWSVARRSLLALMLLVGVLGAAGWVLLPRQIDISESWVPRPNPRWSCTGWSFVYYPPETFDAAATVYCVGLEERIADG